MQYYIFNNSIFVSDGTNLKRCSSERMKSIGGEARVCIVDVDTAIAAAPEQRPEQKDLILEKAFAEAYRGSYVIQAERIAPNIFQVFGVRSERVREVYASLANVRIVTVIPYGMALRRYLNAQGVGTQGQVMAFVDDLAGEVLITFYDGLKFSQTRRFNEYSAEKVLPEIKRSAIGFSKTANHGNEKYTILTNNEHWAACFRDLEPEQEVVHLPCSCPAIEGLKQGQFPVQFEIPEQVLKRSRDKAEKANLWLYSCLLVVLVLLLGLLSFNAASLLLEKRSCKRSQALHQALETQLRELDPLIYRSALANDKTLDYGSTYYHLRNLIPAAYEVSSFTITKKDGKRSLELLLALRKGQSYEELLVATVFKRVTVENVLVKDRPGKLIRIVL